jgi:hypothetical protein
MKAAPGMKDVAGVDSKHKTAAGDVVSSAIAAPVAGANLTAGNNAAGQHGTSQSGENGQALQQSMQSIPNSASAGGPGFHGAAHTDSAASASGNALPAPSYAEPAEMSSAKTGINTSQLIQSMHETEMRVGMNSAEFGVISISTSISHQVLSASISLGHAELGRALALHMPAMEEKLSNTYGVQARIEMRGGNDGSRESGSQQTKDGQGRGRVSGVNAQSNAGAVPADRAVLPTTSMLAGNSMRLDVLY